MRKWALLMAVKRVLISTFGSCLSCLILRLVKGSRFYRAGYRRLRVSYTSHYRRNTDKSRMDKEPMEMHHHLLLRVRTRNKNLK
jgi:hypothetical protein